MRLPDGYMQCPTCIGLGRFTTEEHVCRFPEECELYCPQTVHEMCPTCRGEGIIDILEALANE